MLNLQEQSYPRAIGLFEVIGYRRVKDKTELDSLLLIQENRLVSNADFYGALVSDGEFMPYAERDEEITPFMRESLLALVELGLLYIEYKGKDEDS